MKKLPLTLLALCGAFSFVPGASAEECKEVPTCAELGFTQNASECTGAALKCPWDLSKAACTAGGIKPITCEVGAILGNDRLCYSSDAGVPEGVNAIGVVFDTTKQLAISLKTVTPAVKWSEKNCDVPELQNCTSINCGTGGWENSNAIGVAGYNDACSDMNPLANLAAANYTAPGCDKVFCSQGQWHLPSISELETIIDIVAVKGNPIDKALSTAGGVLFFVTDYWSSTEHSANLAWATGIKTNGSGMPKTMSAFVRPVLYYGPDDVCIVANCKTCKDRNMGSCAVCNSGYTASPLAGVCLKN